MIKSQSLIDQRRSLKTREDIKLAVKREQRIELGKRIQKLIKKRLAERKDAQMNSIISEFRGLRRLTDLSGRRRQNGIVEMRGKDGSVHRGKKQIAEVFAVFYEEFFKSRGGRRCKMPEVVTDSRCVPPFSLIELKEALGNMKSGNACGASGLIAEMMKVDCEALQRMILDLFNDVLISGRPPPDDWRSSQLVVIFKQEDPKMPAN